jgi:CspA family cold shock protein
LGLLAWLARLVVVRVGKSSTPFSIPASARRDLFAVADRFGIPLKPRRALRRNSSTSIGQDTHMAAAVSGTIKRIVSDKGFGFVAADDGTEYFFHNSAVQGTRFDELREGQKVTFEKGQGPKGPRAENLRPV